MQTIGWFLLNIVQAIFLASWSAFWMGSAVVVRLVTGKPEVALAMARLYYSIPVIRAAGARLQVEPLPDIDWKQPHIYLLNHQSMIDIPAAFAALPVNVRFIAKKILQYVPFLGWYAMATGMIFVDRSNRQRAVKSLEQAGERIRAGANIIAFPEGTRTRNGKILPFKKGPFVVALEAQVPIVPMAIEGSGAVVGTGGFAVRPGLIRVKVGKPIPTKGLTHADRDALLRQVRDAIIALHLEIGGQGGAPQEIASAGLEGE